MTDIYHLLEQIHFKCQKAQPMLPKAKREIIGFHSRKSLVLLESVL